MKKSFLILMLMALLPMAGFALTLDVSKFKCQNIDFGTTALPDVEDVTGSTYILGTDYSVEDGYFYTSDTGAGRTAIGTAGATLATTAKGKYYRKVIGLADYDGQAVYVDFWINGVDVDLTITGGISKTFGQNDPELEFTLFKHGTTTAITDAGLTITREPGNDVKAGGYAFSFTWTNESYDITRTDASVFTINPKAIGGTATITAWQGDVTYTGNDIIGVYTVKDGETTLTAGTDGGTGDYYVSAAHDAGDYTPTITFQNNYSGSIDVAAEKKFTVKQAPIVVGVEDLEATYDGATDFHDRTVAAAGKFTYSGLVGGDLANATFIKSKFVAPTSVLTKAATAVNAGEYELEITGGNTGTYDGANKNYKFEVYMPGKLTVKKADLDIKAADAEKGIGEADPAFTLTYPGTLTITGVTFTREEGETAGEYKITPIVTAIVIKDGDNDVTANYNPVVDATGKLTIGKTKIYVAIKDASKLYGEADPDFTYTVTGLKGEDKLAAFTITREEGEAVNSYALTATVANPNEAKYSEVVVANGIFTIKKAPLTFTIPAQTLEIGAAETALKKDGITIDGIKKEEDKTAAATLYTLAFKGGVAADVNKVVADGIYATLTDAAKACYEINGDAANYVSETTASGKLIVGTGGGLDIADLDYATIQARNGETVGEVKVIITAARNARQVPTGTAHPWKAKTWNTMVLPFKVKVRDLSHQLGYAIVNVVDKDATTEGNVQFKLEMEEIPANTPFCVKTDADVADDTELTFTNVLMVDGGENPSVDAGMGYKFVGSYKNLVVDKTKSTYNFLRGDNNKWAHIGSGSANTWTVVPFDAYVDLGTEEAAARGVTFTFQELDGSMTAIKSVEASVNEKSSVKEGWYNLNGVKMEGAPTQKGIYINNGKKVVIK